MKRIFVPIAAVALVTVFSACTEVNPLQISAGPGDTTTTTQPKAVLIEDFTGVHCPNCPAAHEIATALQEAYLGRVEVIAIHNGDLADPYPGDPDLQAAAGDALNNYLGPADYWPKGAIDRMFNSESDGSMFDRTVWTATVATALTDTLKAEVNLSKNYNAATRQLTLNVSLDYLTDVTDAQKITVYLTESGIVTKQEFPSHVDTAYVQNNVLRATLTDPVGDAITESTTSGAQIQRTYNFTLPQNWVAENCRAVVFVSNFTADQATGKKVLQVAGIDVQ